MQVKLLTILKFVLAANNHIASVWLENKSDWKQWQEALRNAKEIVKSF